jgi:phosphoribosyl 1,2-cyclic phosphate phosphodiesterase
VKLRAIILGCGSSGGVPRIGGKDGSGEWGACDPDEPKNRRRRCSILVQRADDDRGWAAPALTSLLIDTSPDLREQLLSVNVRRLDGVAYTHDHADQSHGIDDLRMVALSMRMRVPVHYSKRSAPRLTERFAYCFEDNPETGYPAILDASPFDDSGFSIGGPTGSIPVRPFLGQHGAVRAHGFRFGDEGGIAYAPDMNGLPDEVWPAIDGVETFIVDALRYRPHPSHAHVDQALEWIERSGARRGVLTNLHVDLDYRTLRDELPAHVEPAFDGMTVETGAP